MKNISIGQKEIIHFIGIGGIGMSGLAQVMKNMGFKILGNDLVIKKKCLKNNPYILTKFILIPYEF